MTLKEILIYSILFESIQFCFKTLTRQPDSQQNLNLPNNIQNTSNLGFTAPISISAIQTPSLYSFMQTPTPFLPCHWQTFCNYQLINNWNIASRRANSMQADWANHVYSRLF